MQISVQNYGIHFVKDFIQVGAVAEAVVVATTMNI
jgi:hypothetical protein